MIAEALEQVLDRAEGRARMTLLVEDLGASNTEKVLIVEAAIAQFREAHAWWVERAETLPAETAPSDYAAVDVLILGALLGKELSRE